MLAFIVQLMALILIGHVTATNFGFGSNYFPSLIYPSFGLPSGGWGGGYSYMSGFGGFTFPSSYGYLPKSVKNSVPLSPEGGYGVFIVTFDRLCMNDLFLSIYSKFAFQQAVYSVTYSNCNKNDTGIKRKAFKQLSMHENVRRAIDVEFG
ncbi:hypothetical protein CHS0354_007942 [Potamilus streckersoni]|uniref:Uncharacterized protein n=1 Tax=Potamilus streckersoni TaxID=2493646 RepID=A0AAE0S8M6_9BIVA|nr:hypothetical protein CHS0354_007942 [Potamilus streckersoni]